MDATVHGPLSIIYGKLCILYKAEPSGMTQAHFRKVTQLLVFGSLEPFKHKKTNLI